MNKFLNVIIVFIALEKFGKELRQYRRDLEKTLKKAMEKTVLEIEAEAKRRCPVDTGRLRSSINPKVKSPTEGSVGTNVEYAKYVEYGTRRRDKGSGNGRGRGRGRGNHPGMRAQPFLEPAFIVGKKRAKKYFNEAFDGLADFLQRKIG